MIAVSSHALLHCDHRSSPLDLFLDFLRLILSFSDLSAQVSQFGVLLGKLDTGHRVGGIAGEMLEDVFSAQMLRDALKNHCAVIIALIFDIFGSLNFEQ